MDWTKAKNLTIIFLLMLNVALFTFYLATPKEFKMTEKKKNNIINLLEQNNIKFSGTIPKTFRPKHQLAAEYIAPDINKISKSIYGDTAVERSIGINYTTVSNGESTLQLVDTTLTYSAKMTDIVLDKLTAENICNDLLDKLECQRYEQLYFYEMSNQYYAAFCEKYAGYNIASSFVTITLNPEELQLTYERSKPIRFVGSEEEICSPDEALLSIISIVPSGTNITSMNIIYSKEISQSSEGTVNLIPFYRIETISNSSYMINAYTNEAYEE